MTAYVGLRGTAPPRPCPEGEGVAGAARGNTPPPPDQAAFIDAMSMTKRYFTSLFTMR